MLSRTVMIVIAALATSALGATPIGCPGDGSLMLLIVRPGAAIEAVDLSWSGGGSQGLFSDDKTEHVFMMYESGDFQPAGVAKAKCSVQRPSRTDGYCEVIRLGLADADKKEGLLSCTKL